MSYDIAYIEHWDDHKAGEARWTWCYVNVTPGPTGVVNEAGAQDVLKPMFLCKCGNSVSTLDYSSNDNVGRRWTVTEEGIVSPSIHCKEDKGGCGFHESNIKLLGYKPRPQILVMQEDGSHRPLAS